MKTLFKRFLVLTLSAFALFLVVHVNAHAKEANTLIINYYRFDEQYDNWNVWLWQSQPTSENGQAHQFNSTHESGAVQLEYDLTGSYLENAEEIGFIVRYGSWQAREPGGDRFIDMSEPDASGVVEVFIVSEDTNVYYSEDEVDLSDRVTRANFYADDEIRFSATNMSINAADVAVYEDGEPIQIDALTNDDFDYVLGLNHELDLTKTYHLEVDFVDGRGAQSYDIGFRGIYDSDTFNDAYHYEGELGAIYEPDQTTFKLWAPISQAVSVNLYDVGHPSHITSFDGVEGEDTPFETHEMTYVDRGVWEVTVEGDLHGVYYTYDVTNGQQTNEVVDPYTRSTGVNGLRGMVVDFERLNPDNWEYSRPDNMRHLTDAVIYEAHIRDYTSHETWTGTEAWRGKYLGFGEPGTTYEGVSTGFDHFRDLGVTHVQLLPVHDIGMAIDETRIEDDDYRGKQDTVFNWGYMTLHFNTLEGSYATDPFNGSVRIEEFKTMVQNFHNANIRIIQDVVYNHTATSDDSNFEQIVPGYYFRFDDEGNFSNGSGTGNETASEHTMMRKFMVDSLVFWAEEYNISGYRFDLMRLHDVKTMQAIESALKDIDETILVYGEPWDAGGAELDPAEAADKTNLHRMPGIGVFNDDMRDGIRGGVFIAEEPGWVQGDSSGIHGVRSGIVGGISHPDTNIDWAIEPYQSVSYVSAHDNNTLHDKLQLSTDDATWEEIIKMQKLSNAIVLTAQGLPFIHGGAEIMRTKPCVVIEGEPQGECDDDHLYDHNSYRSPDETNQIDWNWKVDNLDVFQYYQGLINLRRHTDVFNMPTADEVRNNLFFTSTGSNFISYVIDHPDSDWDFTMVAHNNSGQARNLDLMNMEWEMVVGGAQAGLDTIETVSGGSLRVEPYETVVLYNLSTGSTWPQERTDNPIPPSEPLLESGTPDEDTSNLFIPVVVIGSLVALVGIGITVITITKKT